MISKPVHLIASSKIINNNSENPSPIWQALPYLYVTCHPVLFLTESNNSNIFILSTLTNTFKNDVHSIRNFCNCACWMSQRFTNIVEKGIKPKYLGCFKIIINFSSLFRLIAGLFINHCGHITWAQQGTGIQVLLEKFNHHCITLCRICVVSDSAFQERKRPCLQLY